jgi:hypothetical protein
MRAHRSGTRCAHGGGRTICFECFKEGSERTKARQEAWAQRELPLEAAEPVRRLSEAEVAHRRRMLAYLETMAQRRA